MVGPCTRRTTPSRPTSSSRSPSPPTARGSSHPGTWTSLDRAVRTSCCTGTASPDSCPEARPRRRLGLSLGDAERDDQGRALAEADACALLPFRASVHALAWPTFLLPLARLLGPIGLLPQDTKATQRGAMKVRASVKPICEKCKVIR